MKINRLIIINAAESYRALGEITRKYGFEYFEKNKEIDDLRVFEIITNDEAKRRMIELDKEYKLFNYAFEARHRYSNVLRRYGVERYKCSKDEINFGHYEHCKDVDEILKMNGNIIDDERPLYYEDFKRA